jgi:hypothetical protein
MEDQSVVSYLINIWNLLEKEWSTINIVKAENCLSSEEKSNKDNDLEEGLTGDVSPHDWGNNEFVS